MSLEPDSIFPFESADAATARTEPLPEATRVPQSANSARDGERESLDPRDYALSLFLPESPLRQEPQHTVSHRHPMAGTSAATAIFRKLFSRRRAASPLSGEEVPGSSNNFSHLLDARAQIAEAFTRFEARCREIETRNSRAALAIGEIENRLKALDAVRDLAETMGARLNTLDARLADVTERNQSLLKSEQMVTQLERRAGDTSANLSRQLSEFEARKQVIEQAVAALEDRAAQATNDVQQLTSGLDARKDIIRQASAEATRVIGLLTELETRMTRLTTPDDDGFGRAEKTLEEIERRATDVSTQLTQRIGEVEVLRRHLQDLTETARHETGTRVDGRKEPYGRRLRPVRAGFGPSVIARGRAVFDWRGWIPQHGLLIRAVAIAVLLALGAASILRIGRSSSTTVLLSRPLPEGVFAAPTLPSGFGVPFTRDTVRSSAMLASSEDSADGTPPAKRSTGGPLFIGALMIESEPPGAMVFVDQQLLGETPVHLTSLRAGEHAVRLEHEGFERWTASVRVPADRRTRVSAILQVDNPR